VNPVTYWLDACTTEQTENLARQSRKFKVQDANVEVQSWDKLPFETAGYMQAFCHGNNNPQLSSTEVKLGEDPRPPALLGALRVLGGDNT
jgi:hypothetical protein